MATTNPVFSVLASKGDKALLAAGQAYDALTPGQIGVFNYHTNLAVGVASAAKDLREVYIAVGVDRNGDSSTDDLKKSAGQMIQRVNVTGYDMQCPAKDVPKIIEITDFKAQCETEYGIKIEVRNQLGYRLNGYNQVAKTFSIKTDCCAQENCTSCPEGDCNEIAVKLTAAINSDTEKLFKAEMISGPGGVVVTDVTTLNTGIGSFGTLTGGSAYTNGTYNNVTLTGGAGSGAKANITIEGGKVTKVVVVNPGTGYVATNALSAAAGTVGGTGSGFSIIVDTIGACAGIRITSIPMAVKKFCAVNLGYFGVRGTDLIISKVIGFDCNGSVTTTQEMAFAQGLGYDLAQLEYEAGGWNGSPGPYRLSTLAGMAVDSFESLVDQSAFYTVFNLTYDLESVGGWLEYKNNLNTVIAIPCADDTTRAGLIAVLDIIYGNVNTWTNAPACTCPA